MALGLVSCGVPEMDAELIKSMTLGYERGIVAGIEMGDSWEDLKKNVHDGWEIQEPDGRMSFVTGKWDDFNEVHIAINLSEENEVMGLTYVINGKKENHLLMAEIARALESEFNVKYKVNELGGWNVTGPNGKEYSMSIHSGEEHERTGSKCLTINLFKM